MCTYGIDIILNQLWIYVVLQSQRPNSLSGPGPQITGWVNSSTWFDSLSEHLLGVPVPHVCTCWAKRAELVVTMDQWLNRGNHKRYMEWIYPQLSLKFLLYEDLGPHLYPHVWIHIKRWHMDETQEVTDKNILIYKTVHMHVLPWFLFISCIKSNVGHLLFALCNTHSGL